MILFSCQPLGICIASSPSYANLTPSSVPPTLAQSVDSELVLERPSRLPMLSRPLILHDAPPSLRLLHRGMHLQLLPPKRSQEDLPHRCHCTRESSCEAVSVVDSVVLMPSWTTFSPRAVLDIVIAQVSWERTTCCTKILEDLNCARILMLFLDVVDALHAFFHSIGQPVTMLEICQLQELFPIFFQPLGAHHEFPNHSKLSQLCLNTSRFSSQIIQFKFNPSPLLMKIHSMGPFIKTSGSSICRQLFNSAGHAS